MTPIEYAALIAALVLSHKNVEDAKDLYAKDIKEIIEEEKPIKENLIGISHKIQNCEWRVKQ